MSYSFSFSFLIILEFLLISSLIIGLNLVLEPIGLSTSSLNYLETLLLLLTNSFSTIYDPTNYFDVLEDDLISQDNLNDLRDYYESLIGFGRSFCIFGDY